MTPLTVPLGSDCCVVVQCVNAGMDTLTLARFFCETSLLEMDLVVERGSLLASACLLLALLTKDLGGWVGSDQDSFPCISIPCVYHVFVVKFPFICSNLYWVV